MFSNSADDSTIAFADVENNIYYSDTFYEKILKGQPLSNMMYSWWVYPLAYEFNNEYNHLYLGWTDNEGGKGVAQYNPLNGGVVSTHFGTSEVDDHGVDFVVKNKALFSESADRIAIYFIKYFRVVYPTGANRCLLPLPLTTI